jgi:hypothetical protein
MLTDAILHRALRRDEQVLWTGEPRATFLPDPRDRYFIPASVVFLLVATWWFLSALGAGSLLDVWIAGPTLLLALHLSIGRLVLRVDRRRRTTYAITDRRVLAVIDGATLHTNAIARDAVRALEIVPDEEHGTATVRFAPTSRLVKFLETTGIAPLGLLHPNVAFVDVDRADAIPALFPGVTVNAPAEQPAVDDPPADDDPAVAGDDDIAARFDQLRKRRHAS